MIESRTWRVITVGKHACRLPTKEEVDELTLGEYAVIECRMCGKRWKRMPDGGWQSTNAMPIYEIEAE